MNITQQQRQDLTLAVVAGEHQIDADCIRLWRDETKEGTALSQLVDRVAAVVAQSAPDLDTMRTDFHQWCATNGYKTGFVNGGECPMGRPVYEDHRTHAAWWAFQKAAKLYGAQSAQPALRIAPDETVKDAEVIRLIEESGALLAAYEPRVWLVNLKDVRALLAEAGRLAAQAAPTDYEAHQKNGLAWAVDCWAQEVKNRPLINAHRRTLDDTWRQVIRYFGGDPEKLIGPSHDALMSKGE